MTARESSPPRTTPFGDCPIAPLTDGDLMARVAAILDQARANVLRAVNSNMVIAYWLIGREIVQALQGGEARADYGRQLLAELSASLTARYGRGFSATNLRYFRLFYQAYAERRPEIRHEPRDELPGWKPASPPEDLASTLESIDPPRGFSPRLSWTHYRTLATVERPAERLFYEIEAERCGWSQPELVRQIHSHLFIRLVRSRDKAGLMQLARLGQVLERPVDMIKHPYVLGQMDMYVRMYDDLKRTEGDNPSVGLILCAERDEVVARYSVLHESRQLFASKYMLFLPTEEELRVEIERERAAIEAARRMEREP